MVRTDDDTWTITESVGATALFVAIGRAFEACREDPLAIDQFARPLVRAAGEEWAQALDGSGPIFARLGQGWFGRSFQRFQGARTRFFDAVFERASAQGVRQYVILASGLDSRAYRLGYPDQSRVFELDQPKVLDFKTQTLAQIGARPAAGRVIVPIDLRQDWPRALVGAGFDPQKPSAWLVEGLLMYLPVAVETTLLERLAALCAPGSWAGIEQMQPVDLDAMRSGLDGIVPSLPALRSSSPERFADLIYNDPRPDAARALDGAGWTAQGVALTAYLAGLGHPQEPPVAGQDAPATPLNTTTLVAASLPQATEPHR